MGLAKYLLVAIISALITSCYVAEEDRLQIGNQTGIEAGFYDGEFITVEGFIIEINGTLYFETIESRDTNADYHIMMNFDDQTLSCLKNLSDPRGFLDARYESEGFSEFLAFHSIANTLRNAGDDYVGCYP